MGTGERQDGMNTEVVSGADGTLVTLAVLGASFICFGSFFAIVAPGDGQTGMIAFPAWAIGACSGMSAISKSASASKATKKAVGAIAVVAIGSVVWSLVASMTYTQNAGR